MTEERTRRLRRVMEATNENTKAGAIDTALKHYLSDLESKRRIIEDLDDDVLNQLSTPYLPLERDKQIQHTVGLSDKE